MSDSYQKERLDAVLDDVADLKKDKARLDDVFLVRVATAINEGMQNNDYAALIGLLVLLEDEPATVADLVKSVADWMIQRPGSGNNLNK